MLVLSRKVNETVIIGNNEIKIKVVEVRGDKVRLGFEASTAIMINRGEVFDKILRSEKREPKTKKS